MFDIIVMFAIGLLIVLIAVPWAMILLIPLALFATLPIFGYYLVVQQGRWKAMFISKFRRKPRVLIVDDDAISVLPLIHLLTRKIAKVKLVPNGAKMISALYRGNFDLIILDRRMPGFSGEETLSIGDDALEHKNKIPVIFFSNHIDGLHITSYKKFDVKYIWNKQIEYDNLSGKLDRVFAEFVV